MQEKDFAQAKRLVLLSLKEIGRGSFSIAYTLADRLHEIGIGKDAFVSWLMEGGKFGGKEMHVLMGHTLPLPNLLAALELREKLGMDTITFLKFLDIILHEGEHLLFNFLGKKNSNFTYLFVEPGRGVTFTYQPAVGNITTFTLPFEVVRIAQEKGVEELRREVWRRVLPYYMEMVVSDALLTSSPLYRHIISASPLPSPTQEVEILKSYKKQLEHPYNFPFCVSVVSAIALEGGGEKEIIYLYPAIISTLVINVNLRMFTTSAAQEWIVEVSPPPAGGIADDKDWREVFTVRKEIRSTVHQIPLQGVTVEHVLETFADDIKEVERRL